MEQPDTYVPPQPPAWPVVVDGKLRWTAMGPYGPLPGSFDDSEEAKKSAKAVFEKMWVTQGQLDEEVYEKFCADHTAIWEDNSYFPDGQRAAYIDEGSADSFVMLYNKSLSNISPTGYKDARELISSLRLSTDFL